MQAIPQVPSVQVARPCAAGGQAIHALPQWSGELASTQAPAQRCCPAGQAGASASGPAGAGPDVSVAPGPSNPDPASGGGASGASGGSPPPAASGAASRSIGPPSIAAGWSRGCTPAARGSRGAPASAPASALPPDPVQPSVAPF